MTLSVSEFLPFYFFYLTIGSIERITSTFSSRQIKSLKQISKKWFFIPFYIYLGLIIMSIVEFFWLAKEINLGISVIGFVIYCLGAFLRRKSISDLGKDWSVYSEIKVGHTLKKDGIYKHFKHPYYLAVLLELSGAALVANAFNTLILVFFLQAPLLIMRISLEEKMLNNYFGAEYEQYIQGKLL